MPTTAKIGAPNLEQLLKLVSPRVGIIRGLSKVVRGMEQPNPPAMYQAELSHFDFIRSGPLERSSSGKGETEEEAMASAIGEAIEHYCAYHANQDVVCKARLKDLAGAAISPFEFVLYSDTQYKRDGFLFQRPEDDSELGWVLGRELPDGKEVWVPAALVYLNYFPQPPEPQICLGTSNGLAAGPGLQFAMLNGVLELVERDAFLLSWMNRLPPARVDFTRLQGMPRGIARHYAHFGIEVLVFNITVDLPICVMMAIALDRSGRGPAAAVGLGCSLDPTHALTKALSEICQVHAGEIIRFAQQTGDPVESFQSVRTLMDHSAFFGRLQALDEMRFLLDTPGNQRIEDIPNRATGSIQTDLSYCVDTLRAAGMRVVGVDLTTPDIADFGLCVARMVVTELQPMHFGYGLERLGGKRLYEVSRALGYSSARTSESHINPCPHPLA